MKVTAAEFKARCLKLMDEVARTREPVVVTKRGKAVAQLVAIEPERESLFGYMRGTVTFQGEILAPIDEQWSVLSGEEGSLYEGLPTEPQSRSKRSPARRGRKT